jgi:AraC family transcriptional regulator
MKLMQPRIETLKDKKLIGKRLRMSLADNRTGELWRAFMPRRKEITNRVGDDKISMQIYDAPPRMGDFARQFEKWAAVEVTDFENVPAGLEAFELHGGLYAVFDYKGSSRDARIFIYIFTEWLPNSDYELDDRPHFEILGENYRTADPASEEEIWIPIRQKN